MDGREELTSAGCASARARRRSRLARHRQQRPAYQPHLPRSYALLAPIIHTDISAHFKTNRNRMSSRIGVIQEHTRILRQLSLLSYALTALLAYLASYLPLFDSSPRTIINGASRSWTSTFAYPLLRWDVFHYGHTAQYGYVYEHQWAFFPGPSLVMRGTSEFLHFLGVISQRSTWETVLVGGAVIASLCDTSTTLYHLSLHHLRFPSLAFLATLLSLLPSSPATLRLVPYSEPYFTMLSYRGAWAPYDRTETTSRNHGQACYTAPADNGWQQYVPSLSQAHFAPTASC